MAAPGLSQPHLRRQQHRDRDICLECPCDDRLDAVADGIRVEDSGLHQQRGRQERPDLGGVSAGAQLPGLVEPEAVLGCSLGDDGRHDARHPDPGEMLNWPRGSRCHTGSACDAAKPRCRSTAHGW